MLGLLHRRPDPISEGAQRIRLSAAYPMLQHDRARAVTGAESVKEMTALRVEGRMTKAAGISRCFCFMACRVQVVILAPFRHSAYNKHISFLDV